ncbi:hypothetical protein LCGC14_0344220 [marine sediment metagenome]|uniref:Uncharacterized protein n=1 Tax=marine sediment metagenome TaxID=412755 RepID=A0A0F9TVG1_9ZZZZ
MWQDPADKLRVLVMDAYDEGFREGFYSENNPDHADDYWGDSETKAKLEEILDDL